MFIKLHLSTQHMFSTHAPRTAYSSCSASFRQQPDDPQFFTMRAPSSRSPISNSRCWDSWAVSWQPSRPWLGLTSSVGDSHLDNSSSNDLRATPLLGFGLQFLQNSSPSSRIKLPRLTFRISPFCFTATSQIGACSFGRHSACSWCGELLGRKTAGPWDVKTAFDVAVPVSKILSLTGVLGHVVAAPLAEMQDVQGSARFENSETELWCSKCIRQAQYCEPGG